MVTIYLFNFQKKENSTKKPPNNGTKVECNLKNGVSVFTPIFLIKENMNHTFNYLMWENRYYHVNDIILVSDGLISVSCDIDVLATYKNDILNTKAYIDYSSSNYDETIVDGRLSTESELRQATTSASILPAYNDIYIVEYVTDNPTKRGGGVVALTYSQLQQLLEKVNTTDFADWIGSQPQTLANAYDAIFSCRMFPVNLLDVPDEPADFTFITLGGFKTGILARVPPDRYRNDVDITIPWFYNDFRNLAPFTSMYLYLPCYGYFELTPDDYIGKTSLKVIVTIDCITGGVQYDIDRKAKVNTNISMTIPIGTSQGGSVVDTGMSMVSGVVSGVAGAAMMLNPATALMGGVMLASSAGNILQGATNSQQRSLGHVGSTSSLETFYGAGGDKRKIYLTLLSHNTNQEPSEIGATLGRPCKKHMMLSSLSGFCKTIGVSVNTTAPAFIKAIINSRIDGGIYIE